MTERFHYWKICLCLLMCMSACVPAETVGSQLGTVPTNQHTPNLSTDSELTPRPDSKMEIDRSLLKYRGSYFSASGECSVCHQKMMDKDGKDVSIDTQWRASMMANSSRDPYYLAKLREEIQENVKFKEAIESKCVQCHLPMGVITADFEGRSRQVFGDGLLTPENEYYTLAIDGVSCSVCHQVQPDNIGKPESFNGNFLIDAETLSGQRIIFGPYPVDDSMALIMNSASGFTPQESHHMNDAAFCAVCHTLFTNTITVEGALTEHLFAEQTPFIEWQNSQYSPQISCQNCHMPIASGEVNTSIVGGEPRSPFYQHILVGGNSYMLALIRNNVNALHVTAEDEQLDQKIQDVTEQLKERTAKLTVAVEDQAGKLFVAVEVTNLAGHKFPTGYPSRRAWLHVVATDKNGIVVFESGGWREDDLIFGNNNDENPGEYEPHYQTIDDITQVQIYEAIFVDTHQNVSTTLMNAYQYVKDNRLLPIGYDDETAPDEIRPAGWALEDEDFSPGRDIVTYVISIEDVSIPLKIEVELLYQSIGFAWLNEQRVSKTEESQAFSDYHQSTYYDPEIIKRVEIAYP